MHKGTARPKWPHTCWGIEGSNHCLFHLSVGFGVQGGLSQKHQVLLMAYTQLTVEGMVPDLLHIILVGHNALLDRVI